jgi:hypothetical protein
MATREEWSKAYALQADADFKTFLMLQGRSKIPECHELQFLQMACENLAKAYLCEQETAPATLQGSHHYIENVLAVVLRQYIGLSYPKPGPARSIAKQVKHLCQEINWLCPSVTRGNRPDNCEYPWTNGKGKLHVPVNWKFTTLERSLKWRGKDFFRFVGEAIKRLL